MRSKVESVSFAVLSVLPSVKEGFKGKLLGSPSCWHSIVVANSMGRWVFGKTLILMDVDFLRREKKGTIWRRIG